MKLEYDKVSRTYRLGDWHIERTGGFMTVSRWIARNIRTGQFFWHWKRKNIVDIITTDSIHKLNSLYLKSLYE